MSSRSIVLILILIATAACAATNDISATDIQMVYTRAAQGEAGALGFVLYRLHHAISGPTRMQVSVPK